MGVTEGPEPMLQLRNQGMVLGEDHEKMSKSRGNVVAPDDLVNKYGADTVRAYLMFFARWELGAPWSFSGIEGTVRWLRRVWALVIEPLHVKPSASSETLKILRRKVHQVLIHITHDFEQFEFNTIVSSLMELLNDLYKAREQGAVGSIEWNEALDIYLRMLAPVCPHIAEELWLRQGKQYSIHNQSWPAVDKAATKEDMTTLVLQVNGKVRDRLEVPVDINEADAKAAALSNDSVQKFLEGRQPKKVIVIPGKLVNVVA